MKMLIDQETLKERWIEAEKIQAIKGQALDAAILKKEANDDVEKTYDVAADKKSLETILKYEFHIWVAHDLKERQYSDYFKRRYEVFCAGWLHFWDKNISIESKERRLYIYWDRRYVVLYISNETDPRRFRCVAINPPSDPPKAPPPPPPGEV